jgi:antibiotic biosynthesis monooxygenase (ABM) superfamily enzyme
MILRIWHGRTSQADAEDCQQSLNAQATGVMARGIAGLRTIDITRRDTGEDEVEFCTILRFDNWAAVRAFAGADHTAAVLPPAALRLLRSYDTEPLHYDLVAHHGDSVS